jgi:uncharacterized protein (UPF0335 family)
MKFLLRRPLFSAIYECKKGVEIGLPICVLCHLAKSKRYFTIENEIKVLQQDKSALREEFKGRGLDMKTMTAAIAIAKKRQLVPVSRETLDALISEVEEKLPAPED